jgi:hypothetical protein
MFDGARVQDTEDLDWNASRVRAGDTDDDIWKLEGAQHSRILSTA